MLQLLLFVKPLAGFMLLAVTAGVAGFLCAIALPVLGVAALCMPQQLVPILAALIVLAPFARRSALWGTALQPLYCLSAAGSAAG